MDNKIKRRTMIKKSALLASGLTLFGGCGGASNSSPKGAKSFSRQESILVIGAGMSGLSAARALHSLGHQVTVLEGRDRIGGRIWTNRSLSGTPLDLGASWIHGIEGNPITDLTKQFNIATAAPTDYDDSILYNFDGSLISETDESAIEEEFQALLEEAYDANCGGNNPKISVEAALAPIIATKNYSAQERLELNYVLTSSIETETAGATSDLSACHFFDGSGFDGEDVVFPEGYDQVTTQLAKGLMIKLEHSVQAVNYDKSGVTVTTNQGVFKGDRVIVTLPLGVLKQGTVSFTPELPADKQTAIQNLGMGVMNKVYLRFPRVFWDDAEWLGYIPQIRGEWTSWLNFDHYIDEPILMAFLVGDRGKAMQSLSNEDTVRAAMEVLRTIYGDSTPSPTESLITRWGNDPFAYGSYSYIATQATRADHEVLAQPVVNRLFFAGEATSEYSSTVHGAYLSGRREARRIDERVVVQPGRLLKNLLKRARMALG